jgi:cysteine synthase
VGERALIGANAVVLSDVPPGVTMVGIPARQVMPRDRSGAPDEFVAYGTPNGDLPDPVAKALEGMMSEIQTLRGRLDEITGCDILGKAEFLNPGGSVKDRAALYMILDAEREGALQPGGAIVEGTAGNTGIGLALVANARGYRTVIVIPETQSREKMDMLRLCGAELMPVPAKPYKDPENYVRKSERVAAEYAAKEPNGALWANQWDNPANWKGHYESTAPEI